MSDIPKDFPKAVQIKRFCQPKLFPQATGARALAALHDNLLRWRRKQVFVGGGQVVDIPDSEDVDTGGDGAGTFTAFRFYCHAGVAARALVFRLGLARPNYANSGDDTVPVNPRVTITVHGSGTGTDVYDVPAGLGEGGASTDAPSEWSWPQLVCPIAVQEDIDVKVEVKQAARLFSLTCYEVSYNDVSDVRIDELYVADGSNILDVQRETASLNIGTAYVENAAHLVNWCRPSYNAVTEFFGTYKNVLDDSTSVTSATPGYRLETTYHNSVARSTVAVKMAVYASCSAGTGKVRFADSGGTLIEVTGIGSTLQWYTATGTIPAGSTKADIQRAGSGTANVRVHAVSLFELA